MPIVKFGDVVKRANTKEDRFTTEKLYYVGGEHMETGEYLIRKKGLIAGSNIGPMFYCGFVKGQVLLASRSPDLKKAGMVTFDGLCSEKTFVIETKDENVLLQSFLPAIVRSEAFWKYANDNQSGSVNHFINWSTFANYEFFLPPVEQQRTAADLLLAMERVKAAYKDLISKTDALVKSQFIEMFGDPVNNEKSWPTYRFSDVAVSRLGKMLDKRKQTGQHLHKYLANANVQWFSFDLQSLNQMDFDEADRKEFELHDGDLLVCEGGEIGRCAIWHGEIADCYFQKAIHRVRCNTELLLPEYLGHSFYYHSQKNGFSDIVSSKSTIAHLPGDKLKAMSVIVPPIELQKQFVSFIEQSDKSKFEAKQALDSLTAAQKALMRQYLKQEQ